MFETVLIQPLANLLIVLSSWLGSLGGAIIASTLLVRVLLLPLVLPRLRSSEKMKELQPKLKKLQKKHEDDKQKLAKEQMNLYKKAGVNPAAGCLPTILQMVILIALFQVFRRVLNPEAIGSLENLLYPGVSFPTGGINFDFLSLDLAQPNLWRGKFPGVLLVLTAVTQFLTARFSQARNKPAQAVAEKTEQKTDDMAAMMQKQMIFMMPLMTLLIGTRLPAGVTLYWFVFSLTGLIQQLLVKNRFQLGGETNG